MEAIASSPLSLGVVSSALRTSVRLTADEVLQTEVHDIVSNTTKRPPTTIPTLPSSGSFEQTTLPFTTKTTCTYLLPQGLTEGDFFLFTNLHTTTKTAIVVAYVCLRADLEKKKIATGYRSHIDVLTLPYHGSPSKYNTEVFNIPHLSTQSDLCNKTQCREKQRRAPVACEPSVQP